MSAARVAFFVAVAAAAAVGVVGWWQYRPNGQAETTPGLHAAPPAEIEVVQRRAAGPAPDKVEPQAMRHASPFADKNREAIAALERGEVEVAIPLFEECVAGEPEEPVYRHNLAEALVRGALAQRELVRPCEPCLERLERAVELAPDRASLRTLLERWKTEAATEKEFLRDRSVHFELSYDGARDALLDAAPDVLDELERHYIDLSELFGAHPGERGRPRLPVVLYRRSEFTQVTGLDWAGASYDGVIRVPVAEGKGLDRDMSALLRHELVHAFVREAGGEKVPAWLNEGLAQLLARDVASELITARKALVSRELLPLDKLVAPFGKLSGLEQIAIAYAQSLLLCDLIDRSWGRETLLRMVRGSSDPGGPAATFEGWTHVSLASALEDLTRDLQSAR